MSSPLRVAHTIQPEPLTPAQGMQPTRPPWHIPVLLGGMTALVLVTATIAFYLGQNQATVTCTSASAYLEVISGHEKATQWEMAASTAEIASRLTGLCTTDKTILATKVVTDGFEALFTQSFEPGDIRAQQHTIDLYRRLKQQAREYETTTPTALQVAQRAYSIGQYLLTKEALDEAFLMGEFTTSDRAVIQMYVSTLYNLGNWWLTKGNDTTQAEGLKLLVTSHRIAITYQTGQAEAWGLLRERLGLESAWPTPVSTPLLDGGEEQ